MEKVELRSGEVIELRGLTGYEVMLARKVAGTDVIDMNVYMLSLSADISQDAALEFMKTTLAGDFLKVVNTINELSGLNEDAPKSDLPTV